MCHPVSPSPSRTTGPDPARKSHTRIDTNTVSAKEGTHRELFCVPLSLIESAIQARVADFVFQLTFFEFAPEQNNS